MGGCACIEPASSRLPACLLVLILEKGEDEVVAERLLVSVYVCGSHFSLSFNDVLEDLCFRFDVAVSAYLLCLYLVTLLLLFFIVTAMFLGEEERASKQASNRWWVRYMNR